MKRDPYIFPSNNARLKHFGRANTARILKHIRASGKLFNMVRTPGVCNSYAYELHGRLGILVVPCEWY